MKTRRLTPLTLQIPQSNKNSRWQTGKKSAAILGGVVKTKKCNKCGEIKSLTDFYKHSRAHGDGRFGACKTCRKTWQRDYQKRNNERIVEHHRQYRKGLAAGIYTITNTANGKVYVGQSGEYIRRLADHKKRLRRRVHENKLLQEDYLKSGTAFEYKIVKELPGDTDLETLLREESLEIQNHLNQGIELYNKVILK